MERCDHDKLHDLWHRRSFLLEQKMSTWHILYGALLKVGSNWGLLGCRWFPPSFIYNGSNYGDHLPKAVKCSPASSQGCPARLSPPIVKYHRDGQASRADHQRQNQRRPKFKMTREIGFSVDMIKAGIKQYIELDHSHQASQNQSPGQSDRFTLDGTIVGWQISV